MIEEKYIDNLSIQRQNLLTVKKDLNFFKRLFYRKYTDWIMTDEIKSYTGPYLQQPTKISEKNYNKQVSLRMRLSNGRIERQETII